MPFFSPSFILTTPPSLMEEREGEDGEKTTRGQGHGGTYDRERDGPCLVESTVYHIECLDIYIYIYIELFIKLKTQK